MEKWKEVKSPFSRYEVSDCGNVRNSETGYVFRNSNFVSGYRRVSLTYKGNVKHFMVHRLVAECFIPNLDKKAEINHINRIRDDNRVENLEWVDRKENCNKKSHTINKSRPVIQYSMDGEFIKKWDRICDTPFGRSNIASACAGRLGHAYGFKWKYFDGMIEGEVWKTVAVGRYNIMVSDIGRVKLISGKKTHGWKTPNGYMQISVKDKFKMVHVLVAKAFLPPKDGRDIVDHIDRDRSNNHVNNLRWVNHSENRLNSKPVNRNVRKTKIVQIFPNGEKKAFNSIHEASFETGVSKGNICSVCKGNRPKAGGFLWKYDE